MSLDNLTEEEKNLLLQMSYIDLPPNVRVNDSARGSLTIKQFLSYVDQEQRVLQEERFKNIQTYLNENPNSNLKDIKLVGYQNNNPNENNNSQGKSASGFVGYGFKDDEGNATAVFRGSEDLTNKDHLATDWKSNVEAAVGVEIQQQIEANQFYNSLVSDVDGALFVLGHSKGGNLATYVYVNNLDDDLRAHIINGAPIYWNSLTDEQKEALKGERYDFIVYHGDIVSQLGHAPYVDKVIEINKGIKEFFPDFFYPHYETSVEFDKDGNFAHSTEGSTFVRDVSSAVMIGVGYGVEIVKFGYQAVTAIGAAVVGVIDATIKGVKKAGEMIKDACVAFVASVQKLTQKLKEKLTSYFDSVKEKVQNFFAGVIDAIRGPGFPVEPFIKVDLSRLHYYAARLEALMRKSSALNDRIDELYWEVDLLDLNHVFKADILTSFNYRINQNINYLRNTAQLLERDEAKLTNKARSLRR